MLTGQAEDMSKDIHRNVTAFSSPSSLPGAGDTDGEWNQCAVTSVKSASPVTSHSAGHCLEPTSVAHSHKAGQLMEESEAVGAAGSACSEAGEAGKRQTRPGKRPGRGRRKSTTSCISDDNRDDISDDDNCADQTNEPSQWPEAEDRETKHTTAATQSTCIYLGVEDLDTQPPAKDHKHIHCQKQQQQKGLSSGQKQQQHQKISSQQKPQQQQPQHKILSTQQKQQQQNMLSSQKKPQQQQDQQKREKQQQQKILSTQQKQQQQLQQKNRPIPQKQPQVMFCANIAFICKMCGQSFDKRHRLVSHIRYVHCHWRPFVCDLCPATFQSKSRLQRHVYVAHTNERPYSCEACGASFVDRFALNCHRRTHEVDRKHRYFCEVCGKGYHGLNPLKKHLASHSGKRQSPAKTVLCWVCGKAVASTTYLKLHLRKHSPESAITCGVCCKTFTSKQVLDKHLKSRVHRKKLERKNSPLEVCDSDSNKKSDVTAAGKLWATPSFSTVSRRNECFRNGTFTCEICDKPFSSPKSKKRHKRIIHKCDGKEKKIVLYVEDEVDEKHCELSQEVSLDGPGKQNDRADKETLYNKEKTKEERLLTVPEEHPLSLTHKRLLKPPKKYTCDICFQSFSLRQSVQRHKRNVHMKRRDYGCDLCHKTFSDSYYLKHHQQVYHNPSGEVVRQTVKCDVCDKGFLAKSAMTMHKRTVHYGLRRQSCVKCGKKFRDKFTLERHQKSCRREGASSQVNEKFDKLDKETDVQIQPLTALPQVSRTNSSAESASSAVMLSLTSETSPMTCISSTPNLIDPTSLASNSLDVSAYSLLLSSDTERKMTPFISTIAPSSTIFTSNSLTNSTTQGHGEGHVRTGHGEGHVRTGQGEDHVSTGHLGDVGRRMDTQRLDRELQLQGQPLTL
ncbi:zinc finger protein 189-like isoform X2 [Littorina saxatilis]